MDKTVMETQKFWRSLEEWKDQPEAQEWVGKEFMSTPMAEDSADEDVARRDFLKLMGASLALTSMSCVRKPVSKIVPYANRPEEIEPGKPNYYTSSYAEGGESYGAIVKTREGRPIYVKGNPDHPFGGGLTPRAQAHLMNLYDPDRLQSPQKGDGKGGFQNSNWDELDDAVVAALNGGGVRLLTSGLASPSLKSAVSDFHQAFGGKSYEWDLVNYDNLKLATQTCFGKSVIPRYQFQKARMIVSVGADFLGTWIQPATYSRQFAEGRKPNESMNKLVVFEGLLSLTGANADSRIKVRPSEYTSIVLGLAHEIAVKSGRSSFNLNSNTKNTLSKYSDVAAKVGMDPALFSQIAEDLWKNRRQSLVVAGGLDSSTGTGLQIAVHLLNEILGNNGKTVDISHSPIVSFQGESDSIQKLINDINAGSVKTLVIHRANPVYAFGKNSEIAKAIESVPNVIYIGDRLNETAQFANWVAPLSHEAESWGDIEISEGVFSIQQPTIRPLYKTRSLGSSIMNWTYVAEKGPGRILNPDNWYEYVRARWKEKQGRWGQSGSFEGFWNRVLQTGFVNSKGSLDRAGSSQFRTSAVSQIRSEVSDGLELELYQKSGIGSGEYANIAWLQELPDPVTKVTWDNYLLVSEKRAEELGIEKSGQIVKVEANGNDVEVAALILPGVHDDVVGLAIGYGRTHAGRIANEVGVNVAPIIAWEGGKPSFTFQTNVKPTSGFNELANPQGHHTMMGRQLVVEATLEQYLNDPSANIHKHTLFSLWPKYEYKGHRWAMTIDLNKCTGCSACVVACQSENNIPAVGKKYVIEGREMHWIRVDRYFSGDANDPDVLFQPMTCQHCENASCETVCPVAATVHSDEGLNEMAYNRCVGTRYCVNNCPYKVRRFNWFNYSKVAKPLDKAFNPDLTVRSRGVMEKCTFCTQRIKYAKHEAVREDRALKDGDVVTACQEACPSQAIVFGDRNNPETQIAKQFSAKDSFAVIEEYNNVPQVRYHTKVRNKESLKTSSKGGH